MAYRTDRTCAYARLFVPAVLRIVALSLLLMASAAGSAAAWATERANCGGTLFVLWGDGRHDDTAALNAWFRGERVIWGETGSNVGPQIAGHDFRLSSAIYISSGKDRRIKDFRFVWPERKEVVAGGTISAGSDPNQPPVASGLTKVGVGPGEGVPYHSPSAKPAAPADVTGCLVS